MPVLDVVHVVFDFFCRDVAVAVEVSASIQYSMFAFFVD